MKVFNNLYALANQIADETLRLKLNRAIFDAESYVESVLVKNIFDAEVEKIPASGSRYPAYANLAAKYPDLFPVIQPRTLETRTAEIL